MRKRVLAVLAFVVPLCLANAATIYVDQANVDGPWDGTTPATAWKTLAEGVADLAIQNGVEKGGHIIEIAEGDYNEGISLGSDHAGEADRHNEFRGTGRVMSMCFTFGSGAHWLKFDGLEFSTGTGFSASSTSNAGILVTNCSFHSCIGFSLRKVATVTIANCSFYGGSYAISTYDGGIIDVSDCIFMGYLSYAVSVGNASSTVILNNCVFYGNGTHWTKPGNVLNSADQINAQPGCANNIVANPGFADLANDWNMDCFYENSPCLGAGSGGGHIGRFQSPEIRQVFQRTYYVEVDGDDSRSPEQAANPSTPWASVTHAADFARAGDTVMVGLGTFVGEVRVPAGGSGSLKLAFIGSGESIIDANSAAYGFSVDRTSDLRIEGFAIQNSKSSGLYLHYSTECSFSNLSICGNQGVGLTISSFGICRLFNSVIGNNSSHGINASGSFTTESCLIHDNNYGINLPYGSGPAALNNTLIVGNRSYGIWARNAKTPKLINCVIHDNKQGYYCNDDNINMVNCIISSNLNYGMTMPAAKTLYATNCCFFANSPAHVLKGATLLTTAEEINALAQCSDNIDADPLFVGAPTNFMLTRLSPCIDAGTLTTDLETDYFGGPRLLGAAVDIGCHEFDTRFRGSILTLY